jgi:hypothetical protein
VGTVDVVEAEARFRQPTAAVAQVEIEDAHEVEALVAIDMLGDPDHYLDRVTVIWMYKTMDENILRYVVLGGVFQQYITCYIGQNILITC